MGNELTRVSAAEIEKRWRAMNAALERLGKIEGGGDLGAELRGPILGRA